jgi:nucleotide-binding universal stress UspA family protein
MFKTILMPVDGSANSRRAVEATAELVKCHGAAVILLHVIADEPLPRELVKMIASGEITESHMGLLRDSAEIILQDAQETLKAAGVTEEKSVYIVGDPAFQIIEYAQANQVDLIVIGHRGLGAEINMLGSVTRKLVNMSKISCLIIA